MWSPPGPPVGAPLVAGEPPTAVTPGGWQSEAAHETGVVRRPQPVRAEHRHLVTDNVRLGGSDHRRTRRGAAGVAHQDQIDAAVEARARVLQQLVVTAGESFLLLVRLGPHVHEAGVDQAG